jgi:RsiW-degrading membrane proteinase PrsW (M82 family)
MEKERGQSKDEKIVPWSWRIVTIIYMIGYFFVVMFWAAKQKSPWPLIGTIIIGLSLGILITVFGVRAAGKLAERTPKTFMRKCVECGNEIPIASEECPSCGSKQL